MLCGSKNSVNTAASTKMMMAEQISHFRFDEDYKVKKTESLHAVLWEDVEGTADVNRLSYKYLLY